MARTKFEDEVARAFLEGIEGAVIESGIFAETGDAGGNGIFC